jgi:hypothetical protein
MGKKRRAELPDLAGISPAQLAFLLDGRHRGAKWAAGAYENADEAWQANRQTLIRFWADPELTGKRIPLRVRGGRDLEVPGPGHRPFYWWLTEAPEPRRLLLEDGRTVPIYARLWAQGMEGDWDATRGRFAFGVPTHHPPGLRFESEADYVKRLGL